jgi:hypothetical protein
LRSIVKAPCSALPVRKRPAYRLLLKVGNNLPHRVVDFRQHATLFVASRLSNYPDHLYSE